VIHLEVGQPSAPAQSPVLEAARQALKSAQIGYTDATGYRTFAEGDRRVLSGAVRSLCRPCRSRRDDRLPRQLSAAFSLPSKRAIGGRRHPGNPPTATSWRLSMRAGADRGGENAHYQPTPNCRRCGRLDGSLSRARQSDGNDDPRGRPRPACRILLRARHPPDLGRDLPRHHLRDGGGHGAAYGRAAVIVNSFLEILLHDRLAARLDAGPARLARSVECWRRTSTSRRGLVAVAALPVFGCDRTRCSLGRYAKSDLLIGTLADAGLSRFAPAEGAVLPLCRHLEPDPRQRDFCRRSSLRPGCADTRSLISTGRRRELGSGFRLPARPRRWPRPPAV